MAFLYQRKSGRVPALILVSGGILLLFIAVLFGLPLGTNVLPQDTSLSQRSAPEVILSSTRLEQGDTLVVRLTGDMATTSPKAALGQNPLSFFRWQDDWSAIFGIDVQAATGTKTLLVKLPSGTTVQRQIIIQERKFATTELKLPSELVRQGVTPQVLRSRIVAGDNKTLAEVFARFSPKIEFVEAFGKPLDSWFDVGGFGVIRKSGRTKLRHLGVDLEGKAGDAVFAANRGLASFVGQLENFGTSVVIDHGLGIHTAYLHLDKAVVKAGDRVLAGEIIGTVGSSGEYVLAPHLHFSVKIQGASVDPKKFIETTARFLSNKPE